jgi:hypothetical protein
MMKTDYKFLAIEQLYVVLGFKGEDERADKPRKVAAKYISRGVPYVDVDFNSAVIPMDDDIPDERSIVYDPDNPELKLGALFPSMADFRLAIRQYAINEEFELHVAKPDKNRYGGYCKGAKDCTWHVHGRPECRGGDTIIVIILSYKFYFWYIMCLNI